MHDDRNNKGQVIVIVMFLMILALGVGISISNRYINTVRINLGADDSSRAVSIAEAAVERVLLLPTSTLEEYVAFSNCDSDCHLEIVDETGRVLVADVTLGYVAETSDAYQLAISTSDVEQVSLTGYTTNAPLTICWNTDASIYATYVSEDGGQVTANSYAYNSLNSTHSENGFDNAASDLGYTSCFAVTASNTPRILRLKAYYQDTDVYIIPDSGEIIPRQGILIESTGRAGDISKKVSVMKTDSIAPNIFDYVLYQKSDSLPLSN